MIGFIISIYVLGSKEKFAEQAKKIAYALFDRKTGNHVISGCRFVHNTFIGFIGGKIVDSIIIGIICFVCTTIIGTPYAVLVSVIVDVTNIIPFFGPWIGGVPSALLVLMVDPMQALCFVILILVIQQFDGNILGPKILGDSTELSAVGGSLLIISQFTLYADCRHRNRPSFTDAGNPGPSEELYNYIIEKC